VQRDDSSFCFNFYNRVRFNLVSCCVVSLSVAFPVRSRVEFNLGSINQYLNPDLVFRFVTAARSQNKPSDRSKNLQTRAFNRGLNSFMSTAEPYISSRAGFLIGFQKVADKDYLTNCGTVLE